MATVRSKVAQSALMATVTSSFSTAAKSAARSGVAARVSRSTWSVEISPFRHAPDTWDMARVARAVCTARLAVCLRQPTSRPRRAPGALDPSLAHRTRASQRATNPAVTESSIERNRINPTTVLVRVSSSTPSGPSIASIASASSAASPHRGPEDRSALSHMPRPKEVRSWTWPGCGVCPAPGEPGPNIWPVLRGDLELCLGWGSGSVVGSGAPGGQLAPNSQTPRIEPVLSPIDGSWWGAS